VTLAVTGNTNFRSGFSASEGAGVPVASTAVERKSMGHTVANRSSNEADIVCIFCVFPVFNVAAMEKCCVAYGDEEFFFRSGFPSVNGCRCLRGIQCR
jgi:hypothetical protein